MELTGRQAEADELDRLLADAVAGQSRVAVIRGEAGVGKSSLLEYLCRRAEGWHIASAVGMEAEMELAYSGLHQFCRSMLDHVDRLPLPQRHALEVVFGRSTRPAPDRFLVGLATLTLLADAAEEQPVLCVVDDAQWLDGASAQILAFVARRILAERIAIVCAARTGSSDEILVGLPELVVHGLGESDARAAAFLQRAVALTDDPARRSERALAAAHASLDAGAFGTALGMIATAETGPLGELQSAHVDLVRAQVAFASGLGSDAPPLLLAAAERLEQLDPDLARETYLDAWGAALFAGRLAVKGDLLEVSRGAKTAPAPARPLRPSDLLLDGLATLVTEGRETAVPLLRKAADAFAHEGSAEQSFRWGWLTTIPSNVLWDEETWDVINERQLKRAREVGALVRLPIDLTAHAILVTWWGDFPSADSAIAELGGVTEATGTHMAPFAAMLLSAFRGHEAETAALIGPTITGATAGGQGIGVQFAEWVGAILCNGVARYEDALAAARNATDGELDLFLAPWALPELVEAAVKTRAPELGEAALERLARTTTAAGTDWSLGIEARCRALLSGGSDADQLYSEAIDRLSRTRLRPELARARLLYGEWLRREGRRVDARSQLREAADMLTAIGMEAFAERARRELLATGEKARRRSPETRGQLTPQELQIASLARDGLSNPEIGAQLFLSARTVEWHLRKVFLKLGISSRRQLRSALAGRARVVVVA